jgi:hypothetical protein
MSDLDKYLKGAPLTEELAALKDGEDPLPEPEVSDDDGLITDDDREHLKRLLVDPGWPVLLKLLDSDIERREDAAKRSSLRNPLGISEGGLQTMWADVAYFKKARDLMVGMAEAEVERLKEKKKWQGTGTRKTGTGKS